MILYLYVVSLLSVLVDSHVVETIVGKYSLIKPTKSRCDHESSSDPGYFEESKNMFVNYTSVAEHREQVGRSSQFSS